jgi:hypothetical protein
VISLIMPDFMLGNGVKTSDNWQKAGYGRDFLGGSDSQKVTRNDVYGQHRRQLALCRSSGPLKSFRTRGIGLAEDAVGLG